jgi:hypothetical protein
MVLLDLDQPPMMREPGLARALSHTAVGLVHSRRQSTSGLEQSKSALNIIRRLRMMTRSDIVRVQCRWDIRLRREVPEHNPSIEEDGWVDPTLDIKK